MTNASSGDAHHVREVHDATGRPPRQVPGAWMPPGEAAAICVGVIGIPALLGVTVAALGTWGVVAIAVVLVAVPLCGGPRRRPGAARHSPPSSHSRSGASTAGTDTTVG